MTCARCRRRLRSRCGADLHDGTVSHPQGEVNPTDDEQFARGTSYDERPNALAWREHATLIANTEYSAVWCCRGALWSWRGKRGHHIDRMRYRVAIGNHDHRAGRHTQDLRMQLLGEAAYVPERRVVKNTICAPKEIQVYRWEA